MKKFFMFLLTFMMGFCTLNVSAQQTVEIGTGTGTTYYGPFNSLWGYSFVELIYTAEEIGVAGNITTISFNNSSSGQTNNITVYMKNVDRATFTSSSDYETVTASDIVYTGSHNFSNGWSTITLDAPFEYDGTSNLMIAVHEYTAGYSTQYFYYTTATSSLISFHSDSYDPDPYNLGSYSGTVYTQSNRPNIQMEISPSGANPCYKPNSAEITGITENTATLFWTPREGQDTWQVYCDTASDIDPELVTWITVTDTSYTFTGLNTNTQYFAYVRTDCGEGQSGFRKVSFWTPLIPVQAPFSCDFEDATFNENWAIRNGSQTNQWFIGTAANNTIGGENALYISNDNGESNTYDIDSESTVWAFLDVEFPEGNQFALSFDYMVNGEVSTEMWDYLRVIVGAPSNVDAGTNTVPDNATVYGAYVLDSVWTTASILLPGSYANSVQRLYFLWRNDNNTGANPPAVVDNIDLSIVTCSRPENVVVSNITAHTADATFQPADEYDGSWEYVLCPDTIPLSDMYPEAISDTSIALTNLDPATTYKLYVRTVCGSGNYSIWTNPVTFTTELTCTSPTDLTVTQITGNSALVSWHAAPMGATGYTVSYKAVDEENWISETVTESPYMLSGLDTLTVYQVSVTSVCEEGSAPAATKTFSTHCLAGGEIQIGDGTSTSNYIPSYSFYNYGYSQQIFTASEFGGPSTITSLSVNMTTLAQQRTYKIYLAHTTATSLSSGWASTTGAQLVYSGPQTLTTGWNTFDFITPFNYNGSDNLLVIFIDSTGAYVSGNYWQTHSAFSGSARYLYQDASVYPLEPASPTSGTVLSVRNNIIFGGNCDETITCIAPNVYLSNITTESVTVNWVPGNDESSWELEYKAADETEWNSTVVSTSPYTISELSSNTLYNVRMRSVCGGGEYSNWFVLQVRTDCNDIITLPFTENFDSYGTGADAYPTCWAKINTYTAAEMPRINAHTDDGGVGCLYFYTATSGTYSIAITPVFASSIAVNTLQASFMYKATNSSDRLVVGVMTDPENANTFVAIDTIHPSATASEWGERVVSFANYTGAGQYIAFKNEYTTAGTYTYIDDLVIGEIPTCPKPMYVVATSTPTDTVFVSWQDETGEAWDIVYGPLGFNPENESAAIALIEGVTENPYTLFGLSGGMGYDIYVRTNCGSDVSEWSSSHGSAYPFATAMGITGTDTLTGCGFTITDNGGINGDYANNCNDTLVIYPSDEDFVVSVTGIFAGEGSVDYLKIYHGTQAIESNLIAKIYSSMNGGSSGDQVSFGPFTSEVGPLTLYFHSDGSVVKQGYVVFATCKAAPTCPSPVKNSIVVSNIDGHNATITFSDNNPDHNSWTVYYRETAADDEDPWMTVITNDTVTTLTGLAPLTQYDVYVVTNCDTPDEEADATYTKHFTTAVACPAPQNFTLTGLTTNSASVNWFSNAESFVVVYGETGFGENEGTEVVLTESSYDFSNLDPNTSYTMYVMADCGDDSLSAAASFTFITLCEDMTVPYSENFDNYTVSVSSTAAPSNYPNDVMPGCWTFLNRSLTSSTYPAAFLTSSSTYAVSGNCLFFKSSSSTPLYSVLPHFNTALNTLQITFTYRNEGTGSYNGTLSFGYMTNPGDASTFTEINTYAQTTAKTEVTEVLNSIPAEAADGFLVFKYTGGSSNNYYLSLDNILVEVIPTCPRPTDVIATASTTNSITLSWTPTGNETAWEIAYGEPGFDLEAATPVAANTNPFTIGNLTSSSIYEFYVRAVCSATDMSSWSNSGVGSTECDAITTLPYTEDFESYTGTTYSDANGIAPTCWTTYSNNTTYGAPHITGSGSYHYVHSGTNSMVFTCGSAGADAYAALPEFAQPLNTLRLNFWRAMESTSSGTLTVGYVTNISDLAGSFVTVATIPSVSSSSGDTISVDFTDASIPASGNICFHWSYSSSYYSCCIDDINVSLAGSGPGPVVTDPTVATNAATNIAQTTATLNATITNPDNVTISAKGFEWKTTTGGTYTQIAGTGTGNSFTANLSGLTANTGYTFKAFITYNGTTVYGSEMTFTTLEQGVEPCNVPTNLHTTAVENHAINIAWDADASVSSWNIQYRTQNGQWSTATSNTNSYNITGLEGLTTYEIQVQANCGSGNLSDWSASITATTTNVGIEEHLLNSITLYPNPANDVVNVQCTMYNVQCEGIEVIDVYGKVVRTVVGANNDSPTQINVSGLAAGMYFVRVTTDAGVVTKTFIKK